MPYSDVDRRRYWAQQNALTKAEKDLVKFYELHWTIRSYVPTLAEVVNYMKMKNPKATQVSVNYYLTRKPVIKALKDRGIPFEQHTQSELTSEQVATAITIMNFTDTRSNDEKLDQLGILPATYYAWLKDPQFKNMIDSLADQNMANIRPTAIAEFTKLINKGDWNAVKYWLDTTGEMRTNDVPQSEQLLKALIEILQEEIKDSAVLERIALRMQAASQNRTLVIEATDTEPDIELAQAQKLLGFG